MIITILSHYFCWWHPNLQERLFLWQISFSWKDVKSGSVTTNDLLFCQHLPFVSSESSIDIYQPLLLSMEAYFFLKEKTTLNRYFQLLLYNNYYYIYIYIYMETKATTFGQSGNKWWKKTIPGQSLQFSNLMVSSMYFQWNRIKRTIPLNCIVLTTIGSSWFYK